MSKLFLIPTTLATQIDHHVLLPQDLIRIQHLQHFIVETAKIARMHLRQLQLSTPLQELYLYELNKHKQDLDSIMQPLLDGNDVGLMSDCGMPAIADPGNQIVHLAHARGITVVPLVGPSSLLLALMSSGVNGQSFAFQGYLPIDAQDKKIKLKQLEQLIIRDRQSQIIIETPFRNQQLLQFFIENLSADIRLCIAVNLTTPDEHITSHPIKTWRSQHALPNIHKQEVVFVLGTT